MLIKLEYGYVPLAIALSSILEWVDNGQLTLFLKTIELMLCCAYFYQHYFEYI